MHFQGGRVHSHEDIKVVTRRKNIPAADLTLLSLTEVIGGIFWVWLPWLGINEIPSTNTIIGGFFIFLAIFYYSMIMQSNRRFIGLN